MAAAASKYTENSPQYRFAKADVNTDGRLDTVEMATNNLTTDEAAKLASLKDAPKTTKPKVATNAQLEDPMFPTQGSGIDGQVTSDDTAIVGAPMDGGIRTGKATAEEKRLGWEDSDFV